MASLNRVTLIGNLGRDPERKDLAGGTVCSFTLATQRSWTDKASGEKKEATDWHRIVAWGRQAELCCDYLHKGSQVYVDGRIETREYTDKDGIQQRITEVKMQNVQFLGSKPGAAGGGVGNVHMTAASAPANNPASTSAQGFKTTVDYGSGHEKARISDKGWDDWERQNGGAKVGDKRERFPVDVKKGGWGKDADIVEGGDIPF